MPPTKRRYVAFELDARANRPAAVVEPVPRSAANKRAAEARWSALNNEEKATFIQLLNRVQEQGVVVAERNQVAIAADVTALQLRQGADTDFPAFVEAAWTASEAWDGLRRAYLALAACWRLLRNAIQGHGNHLNFGVQHCISEAQTATTNANNAEANRNARRNEADDPPDLPARADGLHKIYEDWITQRHHDRRERVRSRVFRGIRPDGTHWQGQNEEGQLRWYASWPLERGRQGRLSIWVQLSEEDMVYDRAVTKMVFMDRNEWVNATKWRGDVRDIRPHEGRKPMEYHCQNELGNRLAGRPGFEPVVPRIKSNNSFVQMDNRAYGFAMEYCPYGNLKQLVENADDPLPEPFLWRIFHALAKAAFTMEHGHQLEDRGPEEGWEQVIHRDWKPLNIFLSEPDANFFPAYPTPLIGDFGSAIRTKVDDPFNPDVYLEGTYAHGFNVPEQRACVDTTHLDPSDRYRILSPANVYGIGVTMYSIAKGILQPRQPKWLSGDNTDGLHVRLDPSKAGYHNIYSNRLYGHIQACLEFNPNARIAARELLQRIDDIIYLDLDGIDPNDRDSDDDDDNEDNDDARAAEIMRNRDPAKGMVWLDPGDLEAGDARELPGFPPVDRYAVGLARVDLPVIDPLPVP